MSIKRDSNFDKKRLLLYLIATPIGNISELSSRAINIIKEMDYICAEDTRVSGKLLQMIKIKKPLISCHEHNEKEATETIIKLIKNGKKVAYMSDAGMPCISDPGSILVKECILNDICVSPISGPNAGLDALIVSGLDTTHFYFHGFLDAKSTVRIDELKKLKDLQETLIFYEAPHRIMATLKDMHKILGRRKAVIAREITKIHEEIIRGNLEDFITLDSSTLKGEMVIIVEGITKEITKKLDPKEIIECIKQFQLMGFSTKDAIKKTSDLLKISKNDVYNLYHRTN